MGKLKVGITGGIGSGKSSVAKIFINSGYQVFFADDISKNLLADDPYIRKKIIAQFGDQSYVNDKPNKSFLREKIFSDREKLKRINSILHPPTIKLLKKKMDDALNYAELVFAEAALIYESNIESLFDFVIFVESPQDEKIKRIQQRDGLDKKSIEEIIRNQIPDDVKKSHADFTIINDSSLEQLELRTKFILTILKSICTN